MTSKNLWKVALKAKELDGWKELGTLWMQLMMFHDVVMT
jgi:hypothetical protein